MGSLPKLILAVGGSDPSGASGIQADLKTIHANGGYGLSVITAVTAQNTQRVVTAVNLAPELIAAQFDSLLDDCSVAAIKTGMLGSEVSVDLVATWLTRSELSSRPVVVDPVMISSSGHPLLSEAGIEALKIRLLPLATLCTPNRSEAETLSGCTISSPADAEKAARRILELGPRAVLIKGGHMAGPRAIDLLVDDAGARSFESERIKGSSPRGTGCTLAAAIATWLGRGGGLDPALERAKRYVTGAIRHSLDLGRGAPAVDHFHLLGGVDRCV